MRIYTISVILKVQLYRREEKRMQTQCTIVSTDAERIISQVRQVLIGKDDVLFWVLAAILAKGHVLMEDIPGVGKTTMALAFSRTLGLHQSRVQFTPDVLPSDVTGFSVLEQTTGKMTYRPGAIMCNLFLADELNRATSRTQSALLEAMEEGQVTVDGASYPLPAPFVVMATQNPAGAAGTQLLPDSQMDRFIVRLSLGYPSFENEILMVKGRQFSDPLKAMQSIVTVDQLVAMQEQTAATYVADEIISYVVLLINATRNTQMLARGASPRATLAVIAMSKAVAQLKGRDYVVPQDVQECFLPTVTHRVLLSPKAEAQGLTARQVLEQIVGDVQAPRV